jgi:hypothetical protein
MEKLGDNKIKHDGTTTGIKYSGFIGLRAYRHASSFVSWETETSPQTAPFYTRRRYRK